MSKSTSPTKSQTEKFAEAARKLGGEVSEEKFDQALKRVGNAKLTHPARPNKVKSEIPDGDR